MYVCMYVCMYMYVCMCLIDVQTIKATFLKLCMGDPSDQVSNIG